jgi:hypothetical protein
MCPKTRNNQFRYFSTAYFEKKTRRRHLSEHASTHMQAHTHIYTHTHEIFIILLRNAAAYKQYKNTNCKQSAETNMWT